MFTLNDSDRERFLELLERALVGLQPTGKLQFDLEQTRAALQENNINLMGECLAALAELGEPKYDALRLRLEDELHKPQWLQHLIDNQTHPQVLSYAIDSLLSTEPNDTLTVARVIGQLNTLQEHQPNGMEKILAAIELLHVSREFLTQLEPDLLFMYNTSEEQVAETLVEVDQLIAVYQQFLNDELFEPELETETLPTQKIDQKSKALPKQFEDQESEFEITQFIKVDTSDPTQEKREASLKKKLQKFADRAEKDKQIAEATRAKLESLPQQKKQVSHDSLLAEVFLQEERLASLEATELELLATLAGLSTGGNSVRNSALRSLQGHLTSAPLSFKPSPKFRGKDIDLIRLCLENPVYKRMRKNSSANLGRLPSLGLVLQMQNYSLPVLYASMQSDHNKLEVAFCIYLHIKVEAEFAQWLHSSLINLIQPYKDCDCPEELVRTLFGPLFYFLFACGGKNLEAIWPFQGRAKCIDF